MYGLAFARAPGAQLAWCCDLDPDLLDRHRLSHPSTRFTTEYDDLLGDSELDAIAIATSVPSNASLARRALEAGKHAFVEKPIATDACGVRSVMETCQLATEKRLSVVTGLCYRYERRKRETIERIRNGAVGDIVALQCTYNVGELWHRGRSPEWSEMEYQMRNWLYFTWLSGDHVVEQHIHSLDKLAWAMGNEYPVKATASGGRAVRTGAEYGNVFDHFDTVFEWANGLRGFSACRQWAGNVATDVSDWVFGTRGKANLQSGEIEAGPAWRWSWKSDEPDDMYQNEHDELFASIRKGEPIADGEIMCKSTLMAILARMSAYTGQTITWEQALNSRENLSPPAYVWGPIEPAPLARPGVTQFV